jgi:hypothetical protein
MLLALLAVPTAGVAYEAGVHVPMRKKRHGLASRRRQLVGSGALEGSLFSDYMVAVTVTQPGGQPQSFEVIVDSGSSTFAVAAAATLNCSPYYVGTCDGVTTSNAYGDGSGFTAQACHGADVNIAGLSAGQPIFAGIKTQSGGFFTDCSPDYAGINNQGILGLAWATLANSPYNVSTLLDSVVATEGIADMYSVQCCGWDGAASGTGTLVLGGAPQSLFTGEQPTVVLGPSTLPVRLTRGLLPGAGSLIWTNVTDQTYFCVSMTYPSSDDHSSCESGNAIIDSGTSDITLLSDAFDVVMAPVASALTRLLNRSISLEYLRLSSSDLTLTADVVDALPDIVLAFAGGVALSVPASTYFQPHPGYGEACYLLAVSVGDDNIIGQAMMEAYFTVFDKANRRVGFAPIAGCPRRTDASCAAAAAVVLPPSPPHQYFYSYEGVDEGSYEELASDSPPPSAPTPEPRRSWALTWRYTTAYGWGWKWLGGSWMNWGWGTGAPGWGWVWS